MKCKIKKTIVNIWLGSLLFSNALKYKNKYARSLAIMMRLKNFVRFLTVVFISTVSFSQSMVHVHQKIANCYKEYYATTVQASYQKKRILIRLVYSKYLVESLSEIKQEIETKSYNKDYQKIENILNVAEKILIAQERLEKIFYLEDKDVKSEELVAVEEEFLNNIDAYQIILDNWKSSVKKLRLDKKDKQKNSFFYKGVEEHIKSLKFFIEQDFEEIKAGW